MTEGEIKALEKILLNLAKKNQNKINVLEWGSGGSTIYFTDFLRKNDIDYDWLSLEYNKDWHDEISKLKAGDSHTKIVLFDVGNTELKQRQTNMDDYINYPAALGKKYNFILVDGRKRRRCLLEAKKLLAPGGVVVLHDAHRKYYHCAFTNFPYSRFVKTSLWVGKNEQPRFFVGFYNKLANRFYFGVHKIKKL